MLYRHTLEAGVELRLLRYFLEVVETGSTSGASRSLGIGQPTLSRQVRRLEDALGVPLFDRRGGRLYLNAAGRDLVPRARDLLARAAELEHPATRDVETQLEVAAPLTTIADVLVPFLARREARAWRIVPREVVPAEAFEVVGRGEVDVAVGAGPVPPGLASRSLMRPPIWAYLPAPDPLLARRAINVTTLVAQSLIVLDRQHGTRRLFDEAVADAGVSYRPVAEVGHGMVAQALAAAGRGLAIVSDEPRFGLRRLRIHARGVTLRIPLFAAWQPSRHTAESVGRFVDALSEYCRVAYGGSAF